MTSAVNGYKGDGVRMPKGAPYFYIALGDSMSIDDYPMADRNGSSRGAASLFAANDDERWPSLRGQDLSEVLGYKSFAMDGAVVELVEAQRERAQHVQAGLVTLTVGGNDLLQIYRRASDKTQIAEDVEHLKERFTGLVRRICRTFPEASIILTTVYDPTDGTGELPPYGSGLPIHFLHAFNEHVIKLALSSRPDKDDVHSDMRNRRVLVADVHAHFLGHGLSAPVKDQWYLQGQPIEPNARGASEIRIAWLEALNDGLAFRPAGDLASAGAK